MRLLAEIFKTQSACYDLNQFHIEEKINLWSDTLAKGGVVPIALWVGKWVTLKGLVEPVYRNQKFKYEHISISAASASQIVQLTDAEAQYRLRAPRSGRPPAVSNTDRLSQMKSGNSTGQAPAATAPAPILTANQQVFANMRKQSAHTTSAARSPSARGPLPSASTQHGHGSTNKKSGWNIPSGCDSLGSSSFSRCSGDDQLPGSTNA